MSEEFIPLWQDDFNRLFDFNDYKHYFDNYTIDEIVRIVYETEEQYLGKLRILRTDRRTILLTENNEAMEIEPVLGIDTTVKENLEWFVCPKYDDEDGKLDTLSGFDGIWKNKWLETSEPLKNVIISGVTDFYEKFGYWPHYLGEPLMFYGEILVDNKTAYVFMDLEHFDLDDDGTDNSAFITFGNKTTNSKNIEMLPLTNDTYSSWLGFSKEYALESEDPFDPEKRYAPEGKLLNCLEGCQDWIGPEKGCNIPLYHLPVDFRFGEKENSGDWGSLMIFWDGKESFYTSYQQT